MTLTYDMERLIKALQDVAALSKKYKSRECQAVNQCIRDAVAALAAPPRNCDVGTPDEQGERCLAQFDQWRREGDGRKLITAIMAWAQMPYNEEGGAQ